MRPPSPLPAGGYRIRRLAARGQAAMLAAVRRGGRLVIDRLPIAPQARYAIKRSLLDAIGPLFGLARHVPNAYARADRLSLSLPLIGERYFELAHVAIGPPSGREPRSVAIVTEAAAGPLLDVTLASIEAAETVNPGLQLAVVRLDAATEQSEGQRAAAKKPQSLAIAAVRDAGCRYVMLVDAGIELAPGCIEALTNTFHLHERVGAAAARIIDRQGRLLEAGRRFEADGSSRPNGFGGDADAPDHTFAREVDTASRTALLLPTPRFLDLATESSDLDTWLTGERITAAIARRGLRTILQPLANVIADRAADATGPFPAINRWDEEKPPACRVLVIDQMTPEPDRDAGSITALEIMRALRDLGCDVVFAAVSNSAHSPPYTETLAALGIRSVLSPWDVDLADHLKRHGLSYAAVMVFRVATAASHLEVVRRYAPQARLIFHPSDLHFLREERRCALDDAASRREAEDRAAVEALELDTIREAAVTVVHSTFERDLIQTRVPGAEVEVFSWIFEPRGAGQTFEYRRDLVFLGGFRHPPNVDAVRYFVRDVMPLLTAELPAIVLHVVGSDAPPDLKALAGPNVRIHGFVENLVPLLSTTRVSVAPMRYGAGIKGKIVTAMAYGVPVVTTDIGAEGMGLARGENVLIANTPRGFADAVLLAYNDPEVWHRLSRQSLDFVAREYSRGGGRRTMATILTKAGVSFGHDGATPPRSSAAKSVA
ncbi:MAG: glycosyltransferase [Hyphomicrobiaceae bacterium]